MIEEDHDGNDSDDKEEFGCVPANNLDNETVHIKFEEEPKYL